MQLGDQLQKLIDKLSTKDEVDSAFITGSLAKGQLSEDSDIDLVVVLKENRADIRSAFTYVDNHFADVYFFDLTDVDRITRAKSLKGNSMDAVFLSWLKSGEIKFDKSGKISELAKIAGSIEVVIAEEDKNNAWQKVNYNYIANRRYFNSSDVLYHEALELRLLYSTIELVTSYFALRNIEWRGEKEAITYLKENDVPYYNQLISYSKTSSIDGRYKIYEALVHGTLTKEYPLWTSDLVFPMSNKNNSTAEREKLTDFWRRLLS